MHRPSCSAVDARADCCRHPTDPLIGIGAQDRLNKAFPLLYRRGAAGYHLIYDNAGWRLFARTETAPGQPVRTIY